MTMKRDRLSSRSQSCYWQKSSNHRIQTFPQGRGSDTGKSTRVIRLEGSQSWYTRSCR